MNLLCGKKKRLCTTKTERLKCFPQRRLIDYDYTYADVLVVKAR